jgi:broad specificity phosphatase PhoE
MMNEKWFNSKWTKSARSLVKALNKFPETSKVILILRHSHRNDSENLKELSKLALTPEGHKMSETFGRQIPQSKEIRLYFSPIQRCKQTAEGILKGFVEVNGKGTLIKSLDVLFDNGMKDDIFFQEITKYPYVEYLFRWAAGLYPPELVKNFPVYCKEAAQTIWNLAKENSNQTIDIHVSHDLIILALRLGWFGLSPNDFWPDFLGGFAFTLIEEKILLFDQFQFKTIELPFWWKSFL